MSNFPTEIHTERLILRPWRESEASIMYRWASNPAIGPVAGWPVHESVEQSRQIITTVFAAPETYALVLRSEGIPIGSVAIKSGDGRSASLHQDDGGELGYWLAEPYWGRGLMSEAVGAIIERAFGVLGYRRLWCGHYEGNDRSRKVMTRCGFVYHHTEYDKPTLLNELRTEHFYLLERKG